MLKYFARLIDSNDSASIKRFTVLAILLHYIITCFVALFIDKTIINLTLIEKITEYNFLIILIGCFGLAVESVTGILLKKAAVQAAAAPDVVVQQADSVTTTSADTVNADRVDTVNSQTTTISKDDSNIAD